MKKLERNLQGGLRIGIVRARFNSEIGEGLQTACVEELHRLGVRDADITLATVPGALEVPLALSRMAGSLRFDGLIALGAIVRGDTYHFEVVANESARGITDVQLASGIPIANAILTTENEEQALVRMATKGAEAASAAVEMANLMKWFTVPELGKRWVHAAQTQSDELAHNAWG